jgi:hypothetical protein
MMDSYDELGPVQIKCGGSEWGKRFEIGEEVDLGDGVYVGYEGAAVVIDNKLAAVFPDLTDKWGCQITADEILEGRNPITNAVQAYVDKHVNSDEDRGLNVGP